jgi:hypothetical protein
MAEMALIVGVVAGIYGAAWLESWSATPNTWGNRIGNWMDEVMTWR